MSDFSFTTNTDSDVGRRAKRDVKLRQIAYFSRSEKSQEEKKHGYTELQFD